MEKEVKKRAREREDLKEKQSIKKKTWRNLDF